MTRRITVTVTGDGTIRAESSGQPGPKCLDDVALIENLCRDAQLVASRLSSEYYATHTDTRAEHTFIRQEDRP
ncbi:DUF2997 domain-containing protein [Nocardia nova]|uniref:DUF2997 domain-containing protein n=1 Tax=Nocardia nova TaxID=37330 RepID=UPI001C448544|nr:DUF2997 domain-containing protein [Nocardia nova]MBV7704010.1 DUF2997 domain-containing protein [Nocardia nova]